MNQGAGVRGGQSTGIKQRGSILPTQPQYQLMRDPVAAFEIELLEEDPNVETLPVVDLEPSKPKRQQHHVPSFPYKQESSRSPVLQNRVSQTTVEATHPLRVADQK